MDDHKLCKAVQDEVLDSRFVDAEEFEGEFGLVLAAYERNNGCVNDDIFDTTELADETIVKFKYVFRGLLTALGQDYRDFFIIVEPSHQGATAYAVIRHSDHKVVLCGNRKAWAFGHDSLDELEEFFRGYAELIEKEL